MGGRPAAEEQNPGAAPSLLAITLRPALKCMHLYAHFQDSERPDFRRRRWVCNNWILSLFNVMTSGEIDSEQDRAHHLRHRGWQAAPASGGVSEFGSEYPIVIG